jgi:hypothetical protein
MVAEAAYIEKYLREHIDKTKGEVFVLIERKTDANNRDWHNYNYWCKGNNIEMLMCLAEILDRISKQMGLTFDETIEVMKNAKLQDKTIIRSRYARRIENDWTVLE